MRRPGPEPCKGGRIPPVAAFPLYLAPFPLFLGVCAAIDARPDLTGLWAVAAGLPFASNTEIGYSALYVLGFTLRYTNDVIDRANGSCHPTAPARSARSTCRVGERGAVVPRPRRLVRTSRSRRFKTADPVDSGTPQAGVSTFMPAILAHT